MRTNSSGADHPVHGMVPAQQGLDRVHLPGAHVDDGLVADEQLAGRDRPTEVTDERETTPAVAVVLRRVHLDAGGRALGHVHRHVGTLQQCRCIGAVVGRERDPMLASASTVRPSSR